MNAPNQNNNFEHDARLLANLKQQKLITEAQYLYCIGEANRLRASPIAIALHTNIVDQALIKRLDASTVFSSPPPKQPATPSIQAGQKLDGYKLLKILHKGPLTTAYEADSDNFKVTIKVLNSSDPESTQRFHREAQALSAIGTHPNILRLRDYKRAQNGPSYMVMDAVEGCTLADKLQSGPLPWAQTFRILKKIASALEQAHQAGIFHRDLKLENIVLRSSDQEVLLTDFGLAGSCDWQTMTATNDILGTPNYLAPEQLTWTKSQPTAAIDIWALGIIAYELCTSVKPFQAQNIVKLSHAIKNLNPAPPSSHQPSLPKAVDQFILKCLKKQPEQRFASLADCQTACDQVLGQGQPQGRTLLTKLLTSALAAIVLIAAVTLKLQYDARRSLQKALQALDQRAQSYLESEPGQRSYLVILRQCYDSNSSPEPIPEYLSVVNELRALKTRAVPARLAFMANTVLLQKNHPQAFPFRDRDPHALVFESYLAVSKRDTHKLELIKKKLSKRGPPWTQYAAFLTIIHSWYTKNWENLPIALAKIDANPQMKEFITPINTEIFVTRALDLALGPKAVPKVSEFLNKRAPNEDQKRAFNKAISAHFSAYQKPFPRILIPRFQALAKIQAEHPFLTLPEADPQFYTELAKRAQAQGDKALALRYYLKRRSSDSSFSLPAEFRQFQLAQELSNLPRTATRQQLTDSLRLLIEANTGLWDLTPPPHLLQNCLKDDVFTDIERQYQQNQSFKTWRILASAVKAQSIEVANQFDEESWKRARDQCDQLLESESLPGFLKARVAMHRCRLFTSLGMIPIVKQVTKEAFKGAEKALKLALKWQYPALDRWYEESTRLKWAELGLAKNLASFADAMNLVFEQLDKAMKHAIRRAKRTQKGSLEQDRPPGYPLEPLPKGRHRFAEIHAVRSLFYFKILGFVHSHRLADLALRQDPENVLAQILYIKARLKLNHKFELEKRVIKLNNSGDPRVPLFNQWLKKYFEDKRSK